MDNFDLETLYRDYLKLVRLQPDKMSATQNRELKRAFFAGCGSTYLTMTIHLSRLSDGKAMEALKLIDQQVSNFFENEVLDNNKSN